MHVFQLKTLKHNDIDIHLSSFKQAKTQNNMQKTYRIFWLGDPAFTYASITAIHLDSFCTLTSVSELTPHEVIISSPDFFELPVEYINLL